MLQKLKMFAALVGIVIISSCGTNKKLTAALSEIDQLKAKNAELGNTIADLQKQVTDLNGKNKTITDEYASYKANCKAAQEKLQLVQAALVDQYNTLQKVQERIAEAVANFKDKGVDVHYKDGLVYVTMEDALLYKSGSATLGEDGKTALGSLSAALNDYPKLKVIVVGNTDDVHVKGKADNLSLSTERANGVVRILRDSYNVDPTRITAAGKGKYNPVADNSSAEGRAKNRRTDIILNPDLDRIWQSVQQ
jgi:chemotaxis protein MotB